MSCKLRNGQRHIAHVCILAVGHFSSFLLINRRFALWPPGAQKHGCFGLGGAASGRCTPDFQDQVQEENVKYLTNSFCIDLHVDVITRWIFGVKYKIHKINFSCFVFMGPLGNLKLHMWLSLVPCVIFFIDQYYLHKGIFLWRALFQRAVGQDLLHRLVS